MADPYIYSIGPKAEGTGALASVIIPPHKANDVLVLIVHSCNEAVGTPTDWTASEAPGDGTGGSAGSTRISVFWRRATSGATSNPAVADPGDHALAVIYCVRGCRTSGSPFNVVASNDTDGSGSTTLTILGATTTVARCLVFAIGSNGTDATANQIQAYPGGTNADLECLARYDYISGTLGAATQTQTNNGNGGGFTVFAGIKDTAGAYGNTTATLSGSSLQARVTLAFEPASAAGGATRLVGGVLA